MSWDGGCRIIERALCVSPEKETYHNIYYRETITRKLKLAGQIDFPRCKTRCIQNCNLLICINFMFVHLVIFSRFS